MKIDKAAVRVQRAIRSRWIACLGGWATILLLPAAVWTAPRASPGKMERYGGLEAMQYFCYHGIDIRQRIRWMCCPTRRPRLLPPSIELNASGDDVQ